MRAEAARLHVHRLALEFETGRISHEVIIGLCEDHAPDFAQSGPQGPLEEWGVNDVCSCLCTHGEGDDLCCWQTQSMLVGHDMCIGLQELIEAVAASKKAAEDVPEAPAEPDVVKLQRRIVDRMCHYLKDIQFALIKAGHVPATNSNLQD